MQKSMEEMKVKATIVAGVDTTQAKQQLGQFQDDIKAFKNRLSSEEGIKLSTNLAQLRLQLKDLRDELKKATSEDQRLNIQSNIEIVQKQVTQANRELNNFIRTGDKTQSVLGKNFETIGSKIDGVNGKINDLLSGFGGVGDTISGVLTGAISKFAIAGAAIAGLVAGLKNASDIARSFESAFAGFEKVFSGTQDEVNAIKQELLDLSERVPASFEELSGLAAFSAQLGVAKENIVDFVEVATQLGSATNLGAEQAVTGLVKFANVLKIPQDQIRNLGSTLVELGNRFPATESEILDFASEMQSAGVIANISGQQILGISTALVSVGINAEAGGSAMVKTFSDISNAVISGGAELQKYATVAGLSATEFATRWKDDAGSAFLEFVSGLSGSGEDAIAVLQELEIKDVRTQKSLLALAGSGLLAADAIKTAGDAFIENTALQEEFDKRLQTTDSRLKIVGNQWRNFGATIGNTVNKVITPAVELATNVFFGIGDAVAVVTKVFSNLNKNAKALLQNGLVSIVSKAVSLVADQINKLQSALGVEIFDVAGIIKSALGSGEAGYVDPFAGVSEILSRGSERRSKAISQERKAIEDETSKLLDSLNGIEDTKGKKGGATDKEKKATEERIALINKEADAKIKSLSTTRAEQEKNAKEILRIEEERNRAVKDASGKTADNLISDAKDIVENQKKAFKEQSENAKKYISDFDGTIKTGQKSIDDLTSKIKSANDEIKKLGDQQLSEQEKLASKYVELQEKLRNPQQGDDTSKIQKDLALITQYTTDAQRAEAIRQSTLTDTQKIVEEIQRLEKEKTTKQEQVAELEAQKELETVILDAFAAHKEMLEKQYTEVTKSESEARMLQLQAEIDKTRELVKLQQQAGTGGFSTASQLAQQAISNTNKVNNNINVTIDGSQNPQAVVDELKRQIENFTLGNNQ